MKCKFPVNHKQAISKIHYLPGCLVWVREIRTKFSRRKQKTSAESTQVSIGSHDILQNFWHLAGLNYPIYLSFSFFHTSIVACEPVKSEQCPFPALQAISVSILQTWLQLSQVLMTNRVTFFCLFCFSFFFNFPFCLYFYFPCSAFKLISFLFYVHFSPSLQLSSSLISLLPLPLTFTST